MGLLIRPFTIFSKKRRVRYSSIAEVLSCFIDREHLGQLLVKTPDRRMLLAAAAEMLGVDPLFLLEQIAAKLNLRFLARVDAMDVTLLGVRKLSELRQMGAIMLTGAGMLRGIVCVDPWQVELLCKELPELPVYMATWSEIAGALDRSEQDYLLLREKDRAIRAEKMQRTAADVLRIVVEEAQQFEREKLLIAFESEQIEYSFTTSDGRSAVGTISEQIRASLLSLLQSAGDSKQGLLQLTLPSGPQSVVIERLNGQQVFGLSWGSIVEAAREPQEEPTVSIVKKRSPKGARAPARGRKKKQSIKDHQIVMVVEDNVTFTKVLERFLNRQNVQVEHAIDGRRALEILERCAVDIDLVVCDVHMPGMNGFEFLQRLRALPSFVAMPVIMLTSDEDFETELRALSDGADAFIPKSRDPRLLCAHIERQLKKQKELRAA